MVVQVLVAVELCLPLLCLCSFHVLSGELLTAWDDSPLLSRSVAFVFADSVFLDSINHAQKEVFVEKLYLY